MKKQQLLFFWVLVGIVLSGCSHGPILQDLQSYDKTVFLDRDPKYNSPVVDSSVVNSGSLDKHLFQINQDYNVGRKDIVTLSFYKCETRNENEECQKYQSVPITVEWMADDVGLLQTLQNNRLSWSFHLSVLGNLSLAKAPSIQNTTSIQIRSIGDEVLSVQLDPFRDLAQNRNNEVTPGITWSSIIEALVSEKYNVASSQGMESLENKVIWPSKNDDYGVEVSLSQQQDYFILPNDRVVYHKFVKPVENTSPLLNIYRELRVNENGELLIPPSTTTVDWSGDDSTLPEESHLRLLQNQLDMSVFRIKVSGSDLPVEYYPPLHLIESCLAAEFSTSSTIDFGGLSSLCGSYGIRELTEPKHSEMNALQRISIVPMKIYWTLVDESGVKHLMPYVVGQTVTDSVKSFYEHYFGATLLSIAKPYSSKVALTVLPGRVNPRNKFSANSRSPFWGWVGDCWVVNGDETVNDCQPDLESNPPLIYPFDTVFVSKGAPKLPN